MEWIIGIIIIIAGYFIYKAIQRGNNIKERQLGLKEQCPELDLEHNKKRLLPNFKSELDDEIIRAEKMLEYARELGDKNLIEKVEDKLELFTTLRMNYLHLSKTLLREFSVAKTAM
jgi:hypothetical protein